MRRKGMCSIHPANRTELISVDVLGIVLPNTG